MLFLPIGWAVVALLIGTLVWEVREGRTGWWTLMRMDRARYPIPFWAYVIGRVFQILVVLWVIGTLTGAALSN